MGVWQGHTQAQKYKHTHTNTHNLHMNTHTHTHFLPGNQAQSNWGCCHRMLCPALSKRGLIIADMRIRSTGAWGKKRDSQCLCGKREEDLTHAKCYQVESSGMLSHCTHSSILHLHTNKEDKYVEKISWNAVFFIKSFMVIQIFQQYLCPQDVLYSRQAALTVSPALIRPHSENAQAQSSSHVPGWPWHRHPARRSRTDGWTPSPRRFSSTGAPHHGVYSSLKWVLWGAACPSRSGLDCMHTHKENKLKAKRLDWYSCSNLL